jgi:hypothetical protein
MIIAVMQILVLGLFADCSSCNDDNGSPADDSGSKMYILYCPSNFFVLIVAQ